MKLYESQKKYYHKNKEWILEKAKKYNEENKEKIRERQKKYYRENKEKIRERQKKYRQTEKYKEANRKRVGKNYQENKNGYKDKTIKRQNSYYKNPEKRRAILKKSKTATKRNTEYLQNFRKSRSCVNCGYKEHFEILQFHHINHKEKNKKMSDFGSIKRMKEEIKKCILLCPNCHYWLHYKSKRKNT